MLYGLHNPFIKQATLVLRPLDSKSLETGCRGILESGFQSEDQALQLRMHHRR